MKSVKNYLHHYYHINKATTGDITKLVGLIDQGVAPGALLTKSQLRFLNGWLENYKDRKIVFQTDLDMYIEASKVSGWINQAVTATR